MSALLLNAFRVLGSGPSRREIALVAKALRESGDVEVGALLDYANNRDLWEPVQRARRRRRRVRVRCA